MTHEEEILSRAGVRPTAIRVLVLREIEALDHTFTLAQMEERLDTLDRSTLFRTLSLFRENHILHEVDNGSGSMLYCKCACYPIHTSHIHFTCTVCGRTFCIKDIDGAQIPRPVGFDVEEINCVMKGVCPECKKRASDMVK